MIQKDYTAQELLIATCLDELGVRYAQQVLIDKYTVDFVIEDDIIIEGDGAFGHSRKSDAERDIILCQHKEHVIHIESQIELEIKQELMGALCLEFNA